MNKEERERLKDINLSSSSTIGGKKIRIKNLIDMTADCFKERKYYGNDITFNDKYYTCKKLANSVQGIVYIICEKEHNEIVGALKKIKYDTIDDTTDHLIKSETLSEIIISGMTNMLLENDICPNFVYRTKLYFCDKCQNDDVSEYVESDSILDQYIENENYIKNNKCIYILSEYISGGNLNSKENKYIYNCSSIAKSIIFQVCVALISMQKYFGIVHNDLHLGNILLQIANKTSKKKFLSYKLNGKTYYISSNIIVKIIDFGRGRIKNNIETDLVIKDLDLFTVPIFSEPQNLADQRRFAIYYLNKLLGENILEKSSSSKCPNSNVNENIPSGFFYDPKFEFLSTTGQNYKLYPGQYGNTCYFIDEKAFARFITDKVDYYKTNFPNYSDVLEILKQMIVGENLEKIIETNFSDFLFKAPLYETVYSCSLDKKFNEITVNPKLLEYINPINTSSKTKNFLEKASSKTNLSSN